MFKLHAEKSTLELKEKELLVSGSVNIYKAKFTFSEEWDGLSKTAVFRAGKKAISVILEEDKDYTCVVPWEVLQDYGRPLNIGVYGSIEDEPIETLPDEPDMPPIVEDMMDGIVTGNGVEEPSEPEPEPEPVVERIVRPTVWVEAGTIYEGTKQGENALPPTPDVTELIFTELNGKQRKLIGMQGQMVGFDAEGEAEAQTVGQPKRYARFVVGTSTAGWTENDCDYLCDGTADEVEINAAIQALPRGGGGEVVILDGIYNLTGSILVNKNKVTLSGNGTSTVLKRAFAGSLGYPGLIVTTGSYSTIRFLSIDGMRNTYSGLYNSGIYLSSASNNSTATGNICTDNSTNGISMGSSSNITITGNTCTGNTGSGIYLYSSSNNSTITGNTCNNNNNNGIYLDSSSNITVTGNSCIRGTGTASDYTSSQNTIRLDTATNNLVACNNIMGKDCLDGGTNNTVANNKYN